LLKIHSSRLMIKTIKSFFSTACDAINTVQICQAKAK
jgi:hypothetical protein